jgi:hypothetical protein
MRDGKIRQSLWACAVWLVASACNTASAPPAPPPEPDRISSVRVVAIAPLQARATVANRSEARAKIEPLVKARLEPRVEIVSSEEMEQIWRAVATDLGAVFDPVSGEVDPQRYDAVEEAVYHELRVERHVDAVLRLSISPVEIYQATKLVSYCGATDPVYWPNGVISHLAPATLVRASCLTVALYDMEKRELYKVHRGLETFETYAWQTRAVKPLEQRLQDPARLDWAVDGAVGPLRDRLPQR